MSTDSTKAMIRPCSPQRLPMNRMMPVRRPRRRTVLQLLTMVDIYLPPIVPRPVARLDDYGLRGCEHQIARRRVPVDVDGVAGFDFAGQDHHGQPILDLLLNEPLERARPVDRVVALPGQALDRGGADFKPQLALREKPAEIRELQRHDAAEQVGR